MSYKLVVCDMDGTLLTSNHRISDYTADIIKKIEDKGIKFMIATGRPYLDARHYRDSLELKSYLITSNGARAHDEDNNPIVVENIPKEYVKRLLAYNVGKDIHRNIYLNDDWIIEYEIDGLVEFHKESGYGFNIDDLNKYENEEVAKVFFTFLFILRALCFIFDRFTCYWGDEGNYQRIGQTSCTSLFYCLQ